MKTKEQKRTEAEARNQRFKRLTVEQKESQQKGKASGKYIAQNLKSIEQKKKVHKRALQIMALEEGMTLNEAHAQALSEA